MNRRFKTTLLALFTAQLMGCAAEEVDSRTYNSEATNAADQLASLEDEKRSSSNGTIQDNNSSQRPPGDKTESTSNSKSKNATKKKKKASQKVVIKTIEEGMNWLKTNKVIGESWELTLKNYRSTSQAESPKDLDTFLSGETAGRKVTKAYIRQWQNYPERGCKQVYVVEKERNSPTHDFYSGSCGDLNQYGFYHCDNLEANFIGQKDVRGHKNAFGVEFKCSGVYNGAKHGRYESYYEGKPYTSYRVVWYHPDSHHPYRIVKMMHKLHLNSDQASRLSETYLVYDIDSYSSSAKRYPSPLPQTAITYQIASRGLITYPGVRNNPVYCTFGPEGLRQISSFKFSIIIKQEESSDPVWDHFYWGYWAINHESRGVSSGQLTNRNPISRRVRINGGVATITSTRRGNTPFYDVHFASRINYAGPMFQPVWIEAGPRFVCFDKSTQENPDMTADIHAVFFSQNL